MSFALSEIILFLFFNRLMFRKLTFIKYDFDAVETHNFTVGTEDACFNLRLVETDARPSIDFPLTRLFEFSLSISQDKIPKDKLRPR